MTTRNRETDAGSAGSPPVFDRAHLARYTLADEAFEREVISLFLTQLTTIIAMIEKAETAAEWRLWTHTLKGSAAAVGAMRLHAVALTLETAPFDPNRGDPRPSLAPLAEAVAELRQHLARLFPLLAA